ncbi:hypothetical protein Tco_0450442 [Tanacetum coccineum]
MARTIRSSRSYLRELMVSFSMLRRNIIEMWLLFLLLFSPSWKSILRANTHVRYSTSSSGTFGHTSTPEHLKKKKSVKTGAPSAV